MNQSSCRLVCGLAWAQEPCIKWTSGGIVVGAFYLRLRRSRLPAPASRFHVTTSVKLFTRVPLSPGSIIWYRGQGGPGAVLVWRRTGHASQTSVVHPPTGSWGMAPFTHSFMLWIRAPFTHLITSAMALLCCLLDKAVFGGKGSAPVLQYSLHPYCVTTCCRYCSCSRCVRLL